MNTSTNVLMHLVWIVYIDIECVLLAGAVAALVVCARLAGCILVLGGVCNIAQVHNLCFSLVLRAFTFALDVPTINVYSRCCWCCALLM